VSAVAGVAGSVEVDRTPQAARRYREFFGVTWNEAHGAVARWGSAHEVDFAWRPGLRRWVLA